MRKPKENLTLVKVKRLLVYPASLLLAGYFSVHFSSAGPYTELSNNERVDHYNRLVQQKHTEKIGNDIYEAISLELDFSVNPNKWLKRKDDAFKTLIKNNAYLSCILVTAENSTFFSGKSFSGVANFTKVLFGDQVLVPFETVLKNDKYSFTRIDNFRFLSEPNSNSKLIGKSGDCNAVAPKTVYLEFGSMPHGFHSLSLISTVESYIAKPPQGNTKQ